MARQHVFEGVFVKERHPFAPLGLSLVTLGIYPIVWWYKINREMRDLGENVSPGISVLAVTLGALLIIPPFVSLWMTSERISRVQERAGVQRFTSPGIALILAIIPIAGLFLWAYLQSGLNRAYDRMARTERVREPPAG